MKITVVGGTGLIGTKLVRLLREQDHEVVAAARSTGVNSFTGDGLEAALEGAEVVVDVSNASYSDEEGAREFFATSTQNLLTYGDEAGVKHHVALSVVGSDRLAGDLGGYFTAKAEQELMIQNSGRSHSIVQVTQFFEFVRGISASAIDADGVALENILIQPMAADDVAAVLASVACGPAVEGTMEFAGPEVFSLAEIARRERHLGRDPRETAPDVLGTYLDVRLGTRDLLPGPDATLAPTTFDGWLHASALRPQTSGV
ncbi:NAD(P)H-binding protein [Planctomonas sp. JC2975]|uniref:SDR family oxidoreductase n=1 Tax=Planctomonas sp. JC2975 TaxID=2729626 RepID=UPI001473D202|nr:NAD(P)H-binding protein [Planctomonas sp. JC2975]NNC12008.1 NAD(P)H-binding protein [Planctomonas sp. JC2975]